jgi:hypothetical protein
VGIQCGCYEHIPIISAWKLANPVLAGLYRDLDHYTIVNTKLKSYQCVICHPTTCHHKYIYHEMTSEQIDEMHT